LRRAGPGRPAGTLDACIDFAEAHLLRLLEASADELDPVEVYAVALAKIKEVRDRRAARGR